ncbi:MAG TPA: hypothetical protein VF133_10530 [Terriglobales bacterium]
MHDYDHQLPQDDTRDVAIDAAIDRLREFFDESPTRLFYSIQIEPTFEREFFHWITGKALLEPANVKRIRRVPTVVQDKTINFYAHPKHRYWKRELKEMDGLLERIFDADFTHAIDRHGELMFDAALGRHGFRVEARNSNTWNGVSWPGTNYNLDRIITRDGCAYGVEIKNTQNYISRMELLIKTLMCRHLNLTPLFIMRFAPKSYIHEVNKAGGLVLLFESQLYPMGHTRLVEEVRTKLGFKIHSPNDTMEGHMHQPPQLAEPSAGPIAHSYSGCTAERLCYHGLKSPPL